MYSRKTVWICGEFRPDFGGIGLLGDEFRDATGGRGPPATATIDAFHENMNIAAPALWPRK
jgi:hypothetical protein